MNDDRQKTVDALSKVGAEKGFFEMLGDDHCALFIDNGKTLFVTFDNLDHLGRDEEERLPWGYDFVVKQGWSMLGMMAFGWTWYRDENVFDFFDRLRNYGFFDKFDKVVFYGASMGGYAAATFSGSAPGATVIAISPQATIDPKTVKWEKRYKVAKKLDFSGRYSFAPDGLGEAEKAYIFYDPYAGPDKKHAALFYGDNVETFKCRGMGHRLASLWAQMKILKPIVFGCVDHSLTSRKLASLFRARRESRRYLRELMEKMEKKGRPQMVVHVANFVMKDKPGPVFRKARRRAWGTLKLQKSNETSS